MVLVDEARGCIEPPVMATGVPFAGKPMVYFVNSALPVVGGDVNSKANSVELVRRIVNVVGGLGAVAVVYVLQPITLQAADCHDCVVVP